MKRKSRARRNPLVQDPTMRNTPPIDLAVTRLVAEERYERNSPDLIRSYSTPRGDFEVRLSSEFDTRVVFGGTWFWWASTRRSQGWSEEVGWRMFPKGTQFIWLPPSGDRGSSYFMLRRYDDTLRIYELREVPRWDEGDE